MTEDDLIEETVRGFIEKHLDEMNCAVAMAWLDKRVLAYKVVKQLNAAHLLEPLTPA